MLRLNATKVITFDCYGTLIDWESGIFMALKPALAAHGIHASDSEILALYGRLESKAEKGAYVKYREVLRAVAEGFAREFGFRPTAAERDCLVDSIADWKPFPDAVSSLNRLKKKFKLGIISNTDNDIFAETRKRLNVEFDYVATAEDSGAYKPSLKFFMFALGRIGAPKRQILHVGQSVYHDIVPAKKLGLSCVLINRGGKKNRFGATLPAYGKPDLELPDLKSLAI